MSITVFYSGSERSIETLTKERERSWRRRRRRGRRRRCSRTMMRSEVDIGER